MADSEPSRKKRVSERQLTKDDQEDDEDNEEEGDQRMAGTFTKAAENVLAQRKFVRAKRPASGTAGGGASAAANPFAGVKLAPTPATAPVAKAALHDSPPGKATVPEKEGEEVESKAEKNGVTKPEAEGDVSAGDKAEEKDTKSEADQPGVSGQEKEAEKKPASSGFGAFAQQGGFASPFGAQTAGAAGSGNSTAFGGFTFGSGSGSAFGGAGFPSLATVFGKSNNGQPVQLFQAASTPAGSSGADGTSSPAITPIVTLKEQPVETGEESERSIFTSEASLFEFADGAKWRERGKGELRVNVSKEETRPARLVMRSKGNLRLLLNASLYADMKLSKMDGRGVTFPCVNCVGGDEKKEPALGMFAVRLKDPATADEFLALVEEHKSRGSCATDPKRPASKEAAVVKGDAEADKSAPSESAPEVKGSAGGD